MSIEDLKKARLAALHHQAAKRADPSYKSPQELEEERQANGKLMFNLEQRKAELGTIYEALSLYHKQFYTDAIKPDVLSDMRWQTSYPQEISQPIIISFGFDGRLSTGFEPPETMDSNRSTPLGTPVCYEILQDPQTWNKFGIKENELSYINISATDTSGAPLPGRSWSFWEKRSRGWGLGAEQVIAFIEEKIAERLAEQEFKRMNSKWARVTGWLSRVLE